MVSHFVDAKTMWGARKKREAKDDQQKPKIDIVQSHKNSVRNRVNRKTFGQGVDVSEFKLIFEQAVGILENAISSNDLSDLIDMRAIVPYLEQLSSSNPEMKTMFENLNVNDLDEDVLRESIREGIRLVRENLDLMLQILNDPQELQKYMEMVPEEYQPVINSILTGNTNSILEAIENIPGTLVMVFLFLYFLIFFVFIFLFIF